MPCRGLEMPCRVAGPGTGGVGGTARGRADRDEVIALRVEAELAAMERLARRMGLAGGCRSRRGIPPAWWPAKGSGGDGGGGMDGFEDVD